MTLTAGSVCVSRALMRGKSLTVASLIKRNHGKYTVVYKDKDGMRRWKATPYSDREEAAEFMRSFAAQFEGLSLRLSQFANRFLEYADVNVQRGTVDIYRKSFNAFVGFVGDKFIELISPTDIESYKISRAKIVSKVTVNIEFRTLKSAFEKAVKWGFIASNPFKACAPFRIPFIEPYYLSELEFIKIIAGAEKSRLKDLIVIAVMSMMRLRELVELTWDQVDFDAGLIRIRNKRDFTVKGSRPRLVPMNRTVRSLLSAIRENNPSEYVFVSSHGTKWNPKSVSHRFKRLCREAALDERVHFHSLRHTGASWLAQAGVSLLTIQRILGHSSPSITQIYSHLGDRNLLEAVEYLKLPTSTEPLIVSQFSANRILPTLLCKSSGSR